MCEEEIFKVALSGRLVLEKKMFFLRWPVKLITKVDMVCVSPVGIDV